MENRLTALKLLLDALNVQSNIQTLDDRKRVQKAVYLGQALTELDLSYRFGWYVLGPYSPSLARDYYALEESVRTDGAPPGGVTLREPYRSQLQGLQPLLAKPADFPCGDATWLELLASWHFLRTVKTFELDAATKFLEEHKPHLGQYAPQAEAALANAAPNWAASLTN